MAVSEAARYTEAEARVAADTLVYEKRATLAVDAAGLATLPSDLIYLEGLYTVANVPLSPVLLDDWLAFLSGPGFTAYQGDASYVIVGRQLRVIPTGAQTLTIFYRARPTESSFDANGVLVRGLTDERAKTLADHLRFAFMLEDRGEPEVAATELAQYELDARRLRRSQLTKGSSQQSMRGPLS